MFKKIIASVLTLGAFVGLISTANINSVSAEEDATTLTDLYYFDFSNTDYVDKMKNNDGNLYSTCLNTGVENQDISFSYVDFTSGAAGVDSNKTISVTGSSIDIGNNLKSFTNAFNFNMYFNLSLNLPNDVQSFTITLNYVTSEDGNIKISNVGKTNPVKTVNNCSASKTQTLTIDSSEIVKSSNAYHLTNSSYDSTTGTNLDIEIIEMIVTVKKESNNVSAKAYAQDGSSINNESVYIINVLSQSLMVFQVYMIYIMLNIN